MRNAFAGAAAVGLAALLAACSSTQDTIRQQREKLESLGASTRLVAGDWLAGQLTPRYTRTAFDALYQQVEQQRSVLASQPRALVDPQGAALSQAAEQLARAIAAMQHDVERRDDVALRGRLANLPLASR